MGSDQRRPELFLQATVEMIQDRVSTPRHTGPAWPAGTHPHRNGWVLPDLAVLMIESLPLRRAAARFVSGYNWWQPKPEALRTCTPWQRCTCRVLSWRGASIPAGIGGFADRYIPTGHLLESTLPPPISRLDSSGPWVWKSELSWLNRSGKLLDAVPTLAEPAALLSKTKPAEAIQSSKNRR